MARLQHIVLITISLTFALLLTGCGCDAETGSGCDAPPAGGTPVIDTTVKTGRFIDSPVEGLSYSTPSQAGVTNANGEFTYLSGETVIFKLGNILVGQATGASELTPFSLSGMTKPTTQKEMEHLINVIANGGLSSFSAAINRATFLQSLDSDSNPDNGITLPAGLQTALADSNLHLNFSQNFTDFRFDLNVKVLRAATRANVYPQLRKSVPSNYAAAKLFAGLGLSPKISQPSSYLHKDLKNNNVIIAKVSTTYDANGNPKFYSRDDNDDGSINYSDTTTYDSYGNLTSEVQDSNGVGAGGINYRLNATFSNGLQTLLLTDHDGDGPNSSARSYFDQLGNVTIYELDTNGDGANGINFRHSYSYYPDGNVQSDDTDLNADGSIDTQNTYSYDYDAHGNITGKYVVNVTNGTSSTYFNTYDANDNLRTEEYPDGGSNIKILETYTYDTNDNLLTDEKYDVINGARKNFKRYTYDSNGNITKYEEDTDGVGSIDYIETYSYDTNGNILKYEEDDGANGSINYRETYSYDAAVNLQSYKKDSDGDGLNDYIETYTNDANGARIRTDIDIDGDGANDQVKGFINVVIPVGWSFFNDIY